MEVVRVVLDPRRLVRASEPEVVGCDDARDRRERPDHLPVEERPGRLAVEEEHRIAAALLHVVHAQAVLLEIRRLERVPGKPGEALVGRAVRLHARKTYSVASRGSGSRERRVFATAIVTSEVSPATEKARVVPPMAASQPAKSPPTGAVPTNANR